MYFRQPNPANKYAIMAELVFRHTTVFCHYSILFQILGLDKVICILISRCTCSQGTSVPFCSIREVTKIPPEKMWGRQTERLWMSTSLKRFGSVKFLFRTTIDSSAINTERGKLRNGLVLMAQTGKEHCKKPVSSFLVGNGDMC